MIYTELTKLAMKIANDAHKDQVDKGGIPYVFHPAHIAEQMCGEYDTCVALLHDVVEDTDITMDTIEEYGFPSEVTEALKLMTHDKAVPYMEYVRAIKNNTIASKVKRADLAHNSQSARLDCIDEKALKRLKKYFAALILLNQTEDNKDAKYYIMDGKRLVMDNDGIYYSITESGEWECIKILDPMNNYDLFVPEL